MFQRKTKSANACSMTKLKKGKSKKDLEKRVRCCAKCELVSICEKARVACPYCGSFFDSRMDKTQQCAGDNLRISSLVKRKFGYS